MFRTETIVRTGSQQREESQNLARKISSLPDKLRLGQLFQVKGLSFDPQMLLNYEAVGEDPKEFNSPFFIGPPNALEENEPKEQQGRRDGDNDSILAVENAGPSTVISLSPVPLTTEPSSAPPEEEEQILTKTAQSLQIVRRIFFCIFFLMYLFAVPFCLF
uniref:WASH_WAHD domain-containing protein n=1 Tax=Angiostrongylus cantonensis TaxID=6313 RepID=A0A158PAB4_ANGCA